MPPIHPKNKPTPLDQSLVEITDAKKALILAGRMADMVRCVAGGEGLNGYTAPVGILQLSDTILKLRECVDAYDDHIREWSAKKPAEQKS